jgi:hypothetical protein
MAGKAVDDFLYLDLAQESIRNSLLIEETKVFERKLIE